MAQYDDSRNPFSSTPARSEGESPWGETASGAARGGLQLPGGDDGTWSGSKFQRPSPAVRQRNQWRQQQQLTPDFGVAASEPEPVRLPPSRNASLPSFGRGPVSPQPVAKSLAQPPGQPPAPIQPNRPILGRLTPPQPGQASSTGLQMHPHSFQGVQAGSPAPSALGATGLPSNVTPMRPSARRLPGTGAAATQAGTSMWQALLEAKAAGRLSGAATGGVAALERLLALKHTAPPSQPGSSRAAPVLRTLLDTVGYRQFLEKDYDEDPAEAETRWACVDEMANALDQHERARAAETAGATAELGSLIRGFLDDFVLQVEEEDDRFKDDKPKGRVLRLMTLHSAKGLEFDCVWMVGMEEGYLPHHRSLADGLQAIDEERRLCYVGVTRAKRRLVLSLCLTRTKWGKSKHSRPSRFLYELTGQAEKFTQQPAQPPEREKAIKGRRKR